MELLLEEEAADWRDIRIEHDRNQYEFVNSVKDRQMECGGVE